MKLKTIITVIALSLPFLAFAQNVGEGVQFIENQSLANVLAKAKAEGKMVFVDCYTSWCGPCKMMATKEFPKKVMGDFFNPKYVSAKYDMEKGEGLQLAKKFDVNAYPTFLILDANGTLIDRIVGSNPAEEFIAKMKTVGGENSFNAIKKRYDSGDRTMPFLKRYLEKLGDLNMSAEAANVTSDLLKGKEEAIMTDTTLCKFFESFLMNPENEVFQAVYKNKAQYEAKLGKNFGKSLESTCMMYPYRFISHSGDYDKARFAQYLELAKRLNVAEAAELPRLYAPIIKCGDKDYTGAIAALKKNYKQVKDMSDEDLALMNLNIVMRAKPQFKDNAKLIGALKEIIDGRYNYYSKAEQNEQNKQAVQTYQFFKQWLEKDSK